MVAGKFHESAVCKMESQTMEVGGIIQTCTESSLEVIWTVDKELWFSESVS